MTYFYQLIKNPKLIPGSEGMTDEPINPDTGDYSECTYLPGKPGWYTFSTLVRTGDLRASRWGIYAKKYGIPLGEQVTCSEVSIGTLIELKDSLAAAIAREVVDPDNDDQPKWLVADFEKLIAAYQEGDVIVFV